MLSFDCSAVLTPYHSAQDQTVSRFSADLLNATIQKYVYATYLGWQSRDQSVLRIKDGDKKSTVAVVYLVFITEADFKSS